MAVNRPRQVQVQPFPSSRRLVTAAMRAGRRVAPMYGLVDVDVTEANRIPRRPRSALVRDRLCRRQRRPCRGGSPGGACLPQLARPAGDRWRRAGSGRDRRILAEAFVLHEQRAIELHGGHAGAAPGPGSRHRGARQPARHRHGQRGLPGRPGRRPVLGAGRGPRRPLTCTKAQLAGTKIHHVPVSGSMLNPGGWQEQERCPVSPGHSRLALADAHPPAAGAVEALSFPPAYRLGGSPGTNRAALG